MGWEPTAEEIEEKLIELAYVWGDIEEEVETQLWKESNGEWNYTGDMIHRAFRVEVRFEENDFGDPCTVYHLLYDVADDSAREGASLLRSHAGKLPELIRERANPWHSRDFLAIRIVPSGTPVTGEICRRLGEKHPKSREPTLSDVPDTKPKSAVELVERDGYWLTPIEVPFYDALRETGLFFAVQPWIQATDRRYRLDFLVFYDGGAVAVELDGHEWHKTKEQRSRDATRDRWFAARKVQTLRWTGSQVHADPQACVAELMDVLRGASARP